MFDNKKEREKECLTRRKKEKKVDKRKKDIWLTHETLFARKQRFLVLYIL